MLADWSYNSRIKDHTTKDVERVLFRSRFRARADSPRVARQSKVEISYNRYLSTVLVRNGYAYPKYLSRTEGLFSEVL